MGFKMKRTINIENIPVIIDDKKINKLYNGDYKKALEDTAKSERNQAIRNSYLKQENMKLKDKVEVLQDKVFELQDKLDKTRIELDYLIHRYYTEESYQLTIEEIERIMGILKGSDNNE